MQGVHVLPSRPAFRSAMFSGMATAPSTRVKRVAMEVTFILVVLGGFCLERGKELSIDVVMWCLDVASEVLHEEPGLPLY